MLSPFFFQAEDGIRDGHVTGVQTCALPISRAHLPSLLRAQGVSGEGRGGVRPLPRRVRHPRRAVRVADADPDRQGGRSEERRVGKECRYRWWSYHYIDEEILGRVDVNCEVR